MRILVVLVLLAAAVCGFGQQATQNLSRYAGMDLRKLTTNEVARLQAEFKEETKVALGEKWGGILSHHGSLRPTTQQALPGS